MDKKLGKDVLEGKAIRGMVEGPDDYVVLAKIKIKDRCEYGKKSE